ncbi:MAG: hypothetical protein LBK94_07180 [Prevotellaceae bacterium]|nr:hypothetical protein [Prevotellaceae bacterium]
MKINLYTDGNKFSSVCNFTRVRTEIYLPCVLHNVPPVLTVDFILLIAYLFYSFFAQGRALFLSSTQRNATPNGST